ncbi:MAG: carbohydrate kinase [Dermatophilaceae bacterium]
MAERVLVIGESLIDIVHRMDGTIEEHPGGSPLNVAIGLARLGHAVDYATQFADDAYGALIRVHLAKERLLRLTPHSDDAQRTSTGVATLDATGAATYEFDMAWDVRHAIDEAPVGHLHTGSIAATLAPGDADVLAAVERAAATGTVSYDPNARPSLMGESAGARAKLECFIAAADVVKGSDEDVAWLYDGADLDEIMTRWGRLGASLVCMTRGKHGSRTLMVGTGERVDIPAGQTVVVDTVGAGDSFTAGLISGLLDAGLLGSASARERLRAARLVDVHPALIRATSCADVTVSRAGANPPTRSELPGYDGVDSPAPAHPLSSTR